MLADFHGYNNLSVSCMYVSGRHMVLQDSGQTLALKNCLSLYDKKYFQLRQQFFQLKTGQTMHRMRAWTNTT